MGEPDLGTPVQTTPRCPRKPTQAPPTPPRSDTAGGLQPGCKSVPRPPPPPWTGLPYDLHAAGAVRTGGPPAFRQRQRGAAAAPRMHVTMVGLGCRPGQAVAPCCLVQHQSRCSLHTWVGLTQSVDGLKRKEGGFLEGKFNLKTVAQRPCPRSLSAHLPYGFQICPTILFLKGGEGPVGHTPPSAPPLQGTLTATHAH